MEDLKSDTKYIDDVDVQKNETVMAFEGREAYGPAGQCYRTRRPRNHD